jgi:hypothetical protein
MWQEYNEAWRQMTSLDRHAGLYLVVERKTCQLLQFDRIHNNRIPKLLVKIDIFVQFRDVGQWVAIAPSASSLDQGVLPKRLLDLNL